MLSFALIIVVLILLGFVGKHVVLAAISLQGSGTPLNSVPDIIKFGFKAFFESFGELSAKYFLLVALVLLVNAVGMTLNVVFKFAEKRVFYFLLLIASVVIGFSLPMDAWWPGFVKGGKAAVFVVSLAMVAVFPYIIAGYLAKDAIGTVITRKLLYIVVLGLLVVQMIIE